VKAIYEHIRDEEGFRGGYSTVKDFVHPISNNENRLRRACHHWGSPDSEASGVRVTGAT
jgi:hypothetical protein